MVDNYVTITPGYTRDIIRQSGEISVDPGAIPWRILDRVRSRDQTAKYQLVPGFSGTWRPVPPPSATTERADRTTRSVNTTCGIHSIKKEQVAGTRTTAVAGPATPAAAKRFLRDIKLVPDILPFAGSRSGSIHFIPVPRRKQKSKWAD